MSEANTEPDKGKRVRRISGILALIAMLVTPFFYISKDAWPGEILAGIFIGSCLGSSVLVIGSLIEHFTGRTSKKSQK